MDRTTGTIEVIKVDIGAFADATMYTIQAGRGRLYQLQMSSKNFRCLKHRGFEMKFDLEVKAQALQERSMMALCLAGEHSHIMVSGGLDRNSVALKTAD